MAEPLTWTTILAIKSMLQAIDGAPDWHTDLGTHPIHTDRTQQPDAGAPFTFIVADEITTNDAATGRSQRTVSGEIAVIIEFCIPKGDTSAELVAHRARADIVRALGATVRGAAAGIRYIAVVSTRITDAPLGGTELVIAQVLARASLTESFPPA